MSSREEMSPRSPAGMIRCQRSDVKYRATPSTATTAVETVKMKMVLAGSFRASNVGRNRTSTCGSPRRITVPRRSEKPLSVTKSPKLSPLKDRLRIASCMTVKTTLAAPLAVRKIVFSAIFDRVTPCPFLARGPEAASAP